MIEEKKVIKNVFVPERRYITQFTFTDNKILFLAS